MINNQAEISGNFDQSKHLGHKIANISCNMYMSVTQSYVYYM